MKSRRQAKILELLRNHEIDTQEELASILRSTGYEVTQATVSRDIREMKLTKVPLQDGRQKYVAMAVDKDSQQYKYQRVLMDGFRSMDVAATILVVHTISGMAMAIATAIDAFQWTEVVGCIAGDDTIMCATHSMEEANIVRERINDMLQARLDLG